MEQQENMSLFELNIDGTTATQLNATGKWAKFCAITIWSMIGILFLILVFFSSKLIDLMYKFMPMNQSDAFSSAFSGSAKMLVIIAFSIIFGLVAAYYGLVYKFGSNLVKATNDQDQNALEKAFNSYKTFLIITGIITILGVVISLFSILK